MKLGFIGVGNMGSALISGCVDSFGKNEIIFHEKSAAQSDSVEKKWNIAAAKSNSEVVKQSKYIVLAVKPQVLKEVANDIKDALTPDNIVLSIAPGITINDLDEMFHPARIVRAMPNTPAMVGEGMTAFCYGDFQFLEEEKKVVNEVFSAAGRVAQVPESMMDAVVCASGSSPAYVFMFIEALSDSVVQCGMPRDKAYDLVCQTVIGSAKLMCETGKHPGELKDMVCSPGGTTIAGVSALEENGFRGAIFEATKACFDQCGKMKK